MKKKIKIGIIGNGWRAMTYVKIIQELNELFELTAMKFRDKAKAEQFQNAAPAFVDSGEFFKQEFDFVLLALPRDTVLEQCRLLFERGIPVLCETPPADGIEELKKLWRLKQKYNAQIQVAEQYFLQPSHSALIKLAQSGLIGKVSDCTCSSMHDYHGISVMRKLLDVGVEDCKISAKEYCFPVVSTCGRNGENASGKTVDDRIKKAAFNFASGRAGFFDFADEQYFNRLRSRHMSVRGSKGEVFDESVHYLNRKNEAVSGSLLRVDNGPSGNLEGYFHRGITFEGEYIYENPFKAYTTARMTDDEIAMAGLLKGMAEYVRGGKEVYPLAEALQDTYLGLLMDESIKRGCPVSTVKMPWQAT